MRIAKLGLLICLPLALASCKRKPTKMDSRVLSPAISPGGASVVFTVSRCDQDPELVESEVILLDLRTGSVEKVLRSKRKMVLGKLLKHPFVASDFCWSPDGKTIYSTGMETTHRAGKRRLEFSIWKFSPKGATRQRIAHYPGSDYTCPRVSPDGKCVVFHDGAAGDLFRCGPDGEAPTRLSYFGDVSAFNFGWAPDGKHVYLVRYQKVGGRSVDSVWKINADTGTESLLLDNCKEANLTVSPSGKYLAVHLNDEDLGRGLFILRLGEEKPKLVAQEPRPYFVWRPGSDALVYVLKDGLYEWRPSTGSSRKLVSGDMWFPVPSSDAKTILFLKNRGNSTDLWKLDLASGKTKQLYPKP